MKKFSLATLLALLTSNAHAAGGFTWVTQFGKLTGLEDTLHHSGIHHYDHIFTFALVLVGLVLVGLYYRSKNS